MKECVTVVLQNIGELPEVSASGSFLYILERLAALPPLAPALRGLSEICDF